MLLTRLIEHTFDNAELAQAIRPDRLRATLDRKQRELEEGHACRLSLCHVCTDAAARNITVYWRRVDPFVGKRLSRR